MFGLLRRHVIRTRFKKLVAPYDQRIAEARAKHQPVRAIMAEKTAAVHAALQSEPSQ